MRGRWRSGLNTPQDSQRFSVRVDDAVQRTRYAAKSAAYRPGVVADAVVLTSRAHARSV